MLVNTFELNNIGAKNNKAHAHYFTVFICLATWRAAKLGICTHFTSTNLPQCSQSVTSLMYVYYTDPHLFYQCLILVVITSSCYLYHPPTPQKNYYLDVWYIYRVFQIVVRGGGGVSTQWGGIRNFTEGGRIFFTGCWQPEEEWFWQCKPFSKLETAFCEYWTSIKIKLNTTCVSKEYETKRKMEQEQWLQLKMLCFIGLYFENCCLVMGATQSSDHLVIG